MDDFLGPGCGLSEALADDLYVNVTGDTMTGALLIVVEDAFDTAVTTALTIGHNCTSSTNPLFGVAVDFTLETGTTANVNAGRIEVVWEDSFHADRESYMAFYVVQFGGTSVEMLRLHGSGDVYAYGDIRLSHSTSATNAVDDVLHIYNDTSGTAAAGFGAAQVFYADSSTTEDQPLARISALWQTATHAARAADLVFAAYYIASAQEAFRIRGASGAPQIGFFGVTPASRGGATADIKDTLASYGLLTNGGASPLDLDSGAFTAGSISGTTGTFSGAVSGTTGTFSGAVSGTTGTFSGGLSATTGTFTGANTITVEDAVTNAITVVHSLRHNSSGTPAAGFGAGLNFYLESTTTENQNAAAIDVVWSTATHLIRVADLVLSAYSTSSKQEAIRIRGEAGGAIGFFQATPTTQPGATTDLGTVLSGLGLRAAGTAYPITTSGAVALTGGLTISTAGVTITDVNVALGTTTGTKFGTATTQKLAFYNSTPIVQPANTSDLGTVLSDLGLRASGTAYPITTSGAVTFTGTVTITDVNIVLSASTGTQIGTANTQKLGFWGATPIARPSGTGETTGVTAGAGIAVRQDSTFTGNVGTTAYRINDLVKAAKQAGWLEP